MKKIISVLSVFVIVVSLAACTSTQYVDTPVTAIVTDKNGQAVTDDKGNNVTEVVTDEQGNTVTEKVSANGDDAASSTKDSSSAPNKELSGNSSTSKANSTTKKAGGEKETSTTKSSTQKQTTTKKPTTTTTTTTTKPTTTARPKKRDVTITVELPYYNEQETELTVFYKVKGDKKYTELETREIVLDSSKNKEKFEIKKIKGDILVYVKLKDINTTHSSIVIPASEKAGVVKPITGIEIIDGGMI